eukprot:5593-Heterococcus_DN1.PRE.10
MLRNAVKDSCLKVYKCRYDSCCAWIADTTDVAMQYTTEQMLWVRSQGITLLAEHRIKLDQRTSIV